jgi:hypothetical protein
MSDEMANWELKLSRVVAPIRAAPAAGWRGFS